MGTWTMIKLIVAVVLLLAAGGTVGSYVWEYHHRGTVIENQKIEIANLKLEKDVLEKKQKAIETFTAKKTAVKGKVVQNEKADDEAIGSGDPGRVIQLFGPYRGMQPAGKIQPPAPRGKSGPGSPTR